MYDTIMVTETVHNFFKREIVTMAIHSQCLIVLRTSQPVVAVTARQTDNLLRTLEEGVKVVMIIR